MLARAFTQNKSAAYRAANSYSLTFRPAATKAFSTENPAAMEGAPVVRSESLRDRTLRRQELQKLMERWDLIVGFTFHVQMKTDHKMFSTEKTMQGNEEPNTLANLVDMGFPGMLPVLSEDCLDLAIKASLALGGRILPQIKFDRKHYIYGDLPQGYQITQKHYPIMLDGRLFFYDYQNEENHILIQRIQMEQDTAQTRYEGKRALIDYNRAGMPLLEIVTEGKNTHPVDAKLIVREVQDMLRSLNISKGNIDAGQLRVDVNVSVKGESTKPGVSSEIQSPTVQIKNVSSARNIERAVEFEFRRHIQALMDGKDVLPETRRYDPEAHCTIPIRMINEEPDYRYFQDPDLPQFKVTNQRISRVHGLLEEVPFEVKRRFCNQFGMDVFDVKMVFKNPWSIELFTRLIWSLQIDPKIPFVWIYQHIYGNCLKKGLNFQYVLEESFGYKKLMNLLEMIEDKRLTTTNGRIVMQAIIDGDERFPEEIATELGMKMVSGLEVNKAVEYVIEANEDIVNEMIETGKKRAVMSLVGQVMKTVNRNGDPVEIKVMIEEKIEEKRNDSGKYSNKM